MDSQANSTGEWPLYLGRAWLHKTGARTKVLPELLHQIPADERVDTMGADGAYDTQACYAEIVARIWEAK